jgi:hypothetical protein
MNIISLLASLATILDFGLALYIFLSEKKKKDEKIPDSHDHNSSHVISGGRILLAIAINGFLVGGVISLVLFFGLTKNLFDIFVVFFLPLVFNFALGYSASNQKAAGNRALLSCLFIFIGLVFTSSLAVANIEELLGVLSYIGIKIILAVFLSWVISILAYRLKNNLPKL